MISNEIRTLFVKAVLVVLLFSCVYNGIETVQARERNKVYYEEMTFINHNTSVKMLAEEIAAERNMTEEAFISATCKKNGYDDGNQCLMGTVLIPYVN